TLFQHQARRRGQRHRAHPGPRHARAAGRPSRSEASRGRRRAHAVGASARWPQACYLRYEMSPAPPLLLVDDDMAFCTALQRALARRGFDVTTAHTAAEACRSARNRPPEYAVIDLKMPGNSGLTLIPQLKSLSQAMRIVVLTGYASLVTAVEAI